jgi:3-hydroxyacyl-CoA dehydrogenase
MSDVKNDFDQLSLNKKLAATAVIGAGGKMGSGIALLLAQLLGENKVAAMNAKTPFAQKLMLMDVSPVALTGLLKYLDTQLKKFAAKKPQKVDGKDLAPENFAELVLAEVSTTTELKGLSSAKLVFEAAVESLGLKGKIFKELSDLCGKDTYFFTNTSSIPISEIEKMGTEGNLVGRVMGVHFYNPPAVQKLVELIAPISTQAKSEIVECAWGLGKALNKIVIPSADVAGFIGNGHFIRDGLFALKNLEAVMANQTQTFSVVAINKITQDYLIRPMGIFQLIDYVGIDVFSLILEVMNTYIAGEELTSPIIQSLLAKGIKGGQNSDGTQKNGLFEYGDKGQIAGVMDWEKQKYVPTEELVSSVEKWLGAQSSTHQPWKVLVKVGKEQRIPLLKEHFQALRKLNSETDHGANHGAHYGLKFFNESERIGKHLVNTGVANKIEDVDGVLENGFFHLYGPSLSI